MTTACTSVNGLDICTLTQGAVSRGYSQTSWYLIDVEGRLRALAGRRWLATNSFSVRVDVRRRGQQRTLPVDIDQSAYRIIQEAVTNVIRHAGTSNCQVMRDVV